MLSRIEVIYQNKIHWVKQQLIFKVSQCFYYHISQKFSIWPPTSNFTVSTQWFSLQELSGNLRTLLYYIEYVKITNIVKETIKNTPKKTIFPTSIWYFKNTIVFTLITKLYHIHIYSWHECYLGRYQFMFLFV